VRLTASSRIAYDVGRHDDTEFLVLEDGAA
jgi:hypothetical protein